MIDVAALSLKPVLHEITLHVGPGETVAVVGSQGSGKTTLLQVLSGFRTPTSGSASITGIPCSSPDIRRVCGVAGDSWGNQPRLTVMENLQLFARLWGLQTGRIHEVVRQLDLMALLHTRSEKLRPGEAMRLGLARALLHDPPTLLLDEPIGDVDRESASVIRFAISEAAERGKAVLLATFGHPKALALADRILYLEDGRLVQPAAPEAAASTQGEAQNSAAGRPIRHVAARREERVLLFAPDEIRYAYAQEKPFTYRPLSGPSQSASRWPNWRTGWPTRASSGATGPTW